VDWFQGVSLWLREALGDFVSPPWSAVFVFLLALAACLISSSVQRLMIDVKIVRQQVQELNKWRRELLKATRARDMKAVEKLMRKKPYIDKLQAMYTAQTMKPMIVYFVPLLILFWLFSGVFGDAGVAYVPIISDIIKRLVPFWVWYFLSSLAISPILQRVFNLDFQSSD
jgi:uncharacterized membrane protein (DUF106 family)